MAALTSERKKALLANLAGELGIATTPAPVANIWQDSPGHSDGDYFVTGPELKFPHPRFSTGEAAEQFCREREWTFKHRPLIKPREKTEHR